MIMGFFFVGLGMFILGFVVGVASGPECACCDYDDDCCENCGSEVCSCIWNDDDE